MSNYDPDSVVRYFDDIGVGEYERFDSSPVQRIKLDLHLRCLRKYVPAGGRVLEIGAGPGRFTEALAELGCRIVVNDLSPVQLKHNRQRAAERGYAPAVEQWLLADMCDLSALRGETFDAVVAFGGPLSYVLDRRDRALAECLGVLADRGNLLVSVMSLWGTAHAFLNAVLAQSVDIQTAVVRTGDLTPATVPDSVHHCHLFRPDELVAFLTRHGLTVEHLAASNALTTRWDEELSEMDAAGEAWRRVLDFEEEATVAPGNIGMGTHMIAVARRDDA